MKSFIFKYKQALYYYLVKNDPLWKNNFVVLVNQILKFSKQIKINVSINTMKESLNNFPVKFTYEYLSLADFSLTYH